MKNLLAIIISVFLMSAVAHAQGINTSNLDAINSQVAAKAKSFCKYVIAVGSSAGQKGAVTDVQKDDIIKNRVPRLFWEYYEGPRYMLTTNGRNGKVVKKRTMSSYFRNLRVQSQTGINTTRIYELRYVGVKASSGNSSSFHVKKVMADGCTLYASTVMIDQIYHVITWTPEGPSVKSEYDRKELEVNVLSKPNGKVDVYLGDVTRAYRTN